MNRFFSFFIFVVGLAVAGWVGASYVTTNPLALAVTALVVVVYLAGAAELLRYQQATSRLVHAITDLNEAPASLDEWLSRVDPGLRSAVRLRVQGDRVGLPGPALAPYLVGLLVLLGMLGTFLGMVVTLRGTGLALESATDLQAIRASLAAPVQGLGFAFGTSIAGVATSAMLGLLSALCRRERLRTAQLLDSKIATTLRRFSLAHQRDEQFRLLQRQAEASTVVVDRLEAMMTAMDRHNRSLNDGIVAGQNAFHARAEAAYTGLASAVERSLKESVAEGVRAAAAAIQPVVEDTMAGLARESTVLYEAVKKGVEQQLQGAAGQLDGVAGAMSDTWNSMLLRHEGTSDKLAAANQQALTAAVEAFEAHSVSLMRRVDQSHGELRTMLASEDERRLAAWTEVVTEVRQVFADSMVRDNTMLDERNRLLQTLDTLLDAVNHASSEQRGAVDALLERSSEVLDRVGARFSDRVDAEAGKLADVAAQVTSSAVGIASSAAGVASLGEAFGTAVQQFNDSNASLMEHLQHIDAALGKSLTRSDEQLAYYVAQAREVVDLSIMSQKQIIEELQLLAAGQTASGTVAA